MHCNLGCGNSLHDCRINSAPRGGSGIFEVRFHPLKPRQISTSTSRTKAIEPEAFYKSLPLLTNYYSAGKLGRCRMLRLVSCDVALMLQGQPNVVQPIEQTMADKVIQRKLG